MAPYDKDTAIVSETVEKVEPVKEPEATKSPEHRELEMRLGVTIPHDRLHEARQYYLERARLGCDCTVSRSRMMAPEYVVEPVPMPPSARKSNY